MNTVPRVYMRMPPKTADLPIGFSWQCPTDCRTNEPSIGHPQNGTAGAEVPGLPAGSVSDRR